MQQFNENNILKNEQTINVKLAEIAVYPKFQGVFIQLKIVFYRFSRSQIPNLLSEISFNARLSYTF